MWTLPSLTGTDVLIHVTSSSSLQQNAYWNIAQDGNITQLTTIQQYNIGSFKKAKWQSRFYLQDSIKDEELHEEEITISRSLVHIDNSSLGCLTLKAQSNGVYRFELKTFKLQIWVSKVVDVAGIYWTSRKGNIRKWRELLKNRKKKPTMRTELKLFFHKEVKAQEKMQDLRLLRFSATRGGEGICCQRGVKAKSSRHCYIHLWEGVNVTSLDQNFWGSTT